MATFANCTIIISCVKMKKKYMHRSFDFARDKIKYAKLLYRGREQGRTEI